MIIAENTIRLKSSELLQTSVALLISVGSFSTRLLSDEEGFAPRDLHVGKAALLTDSN